MRSIFRMCTPSPYATQPTMPFSAPSCSAHHAHQVSTVGTASCLVPQSSHTARMAIYPHPVQLAGPSRTSDTFWMDLANTHEMEADAASSSMAFVEVESSFRPPLQALNRR